jgi:hypothetical protein
MTLWRPAFAGRDDSAARRAWQIAHWWRSDSVYSDVSPPIRIRKARPCFHRPVPRLPFYEKVKQAISEKIHSGVWRPHDRIPSGGAGGAVWFQPDDHQSGAARTDR